MKKLVIYSLFILLVAVQAQAIDWHVANQITLGWDAVSTSENGDPLPVGSRIKYNVYTTLETDIDKTNAILVNTVTDVSSLVTFTDQGFYWFGVESILEVQDSSGLWQEANKSTIAWSDDPLNTSTGAAFGAQYYLAPTTVKGMRIQ